MPILKQTSSKPLIRDAVVLDLGDLGRQAARLRAAAEVKARQIIADAKAEADRLVAAAHQQGYDEGHARGHAEGFAAGDKKGHAEALAAGEAQVNNATEAFAAVAEQWDEHRERLDREARGAVLDFALRFARKVTQRVVEVDGRVAAEQVSAALSRVLEPVDVKVCIHPEDRPVVAETLPDLLAGFAHLQHVELVDDAGVGRGGCVLRFGGGEVDATLDTQMRRIAELILPDSEHNSKTRNREASDGSDNAAENQNPDATT